MVARGGSTYLQLADDDAAGDEDLVGLDPRLPGGVGGGATSVHPPRPRQDQAGTPGGQVEVAEQRCGAASTPRLRDAGRRLELRHASPGQVGQVRGSDPYQLPVHGDERGQRHSRLVVPARVPWHGARLPLPVAAAWKCNPSDAGQRQTAEQPDAIGGLPARIVGGARRPPRIRVAEQGRPKRAVPAEQLRQPRDLVDAICPLEAAVDLLDGDDVGLQPGDRLAGRIEVDPARAQVEAVKQVVGRDAQRPLRGPKCATGTDNGASAKIRPGQEACERRPVAVDLQLVRRAPAPQEQQ